MGCSLDEVKDQNMKGFFDAQKFAAQIRTKRGARSLRSVARELKGISLSTLSRLENGKNPDTDTFLQICDWLGVSPDDFIKLPPILQEPEKNTLEQILLLLRMDITLDTELVEALAVLLQRLIGERRGERGCSQ
jgi:transcriptional regulator with XRE-family HTH domain